MNWNIPRMWEGGSCIIIGGGPSILEQFNIPESVKQGVYSGRLSPAAYSPYLEAIHDKHIIAVNVAYKMGSWVDMLFFGDTSTWKEDQHEMIKFKGLKLTCADSIDKNSPYLKFIGKVPRKKIGICTEPGLICWNANSGSAAINVAVHTGVKRIILLGFDMKLDLNQDQHWHKFYKTPLTQTESVFTRHLRGFVDMKKDLDALGIEVINCSPNSAIECFKKMDYKDVSYD